ncbi:MAG: hypothetical protein ABSG68_15150 [Thermoguttaceae bacterium]
MAEWSGFGNVGTVVLSAALACALAATLTFIRGYGEVGGVVLSMVLALGLTGAVLGFVVSLKTPGGVEKYYAEKREELSKLQEEYGRVRVQQAAVRQQALQEQAQEDARRRAEEDLARQRAAQNATGGLPASTLSMQAGGTPDLPRQAGPQVVVVTATKSVGISLILTFLFGPLGMLYSTVVGGLVMMVVSIAVGVCTLGFGLLVTWPICIIWGALAVTSYNAKLTRSVQQY